MSNPILVLRTIEPRRVPLSELFARSRQLADRGTDPDTADLMAEDGPDLMVTVGVLDEFAIPYRKFSVPSTFGYDYPDAAEVKPLPPEVPLEVSVGVIVAMDGEEWVIVEYSKNDWMALASTRYIDITK
jgi:hypothetical protein